MMFIHSVLVLSLVVTAVAQTGVPRIRYRVVQWTISVESPQSYESDEIQPYETHGFQTSDSDEIQPYDSDENQPIESDKSLGANEQGELIESPVWFLFLVVPMVLLTAMGALAVGYYLCVWRGGRLGYRPSRDLLTNF